MKKNTIMDIILLLLIINLSCFVIGYLNRDRISNIKEEDVPEEKFVTRKVDDDNNESNPEDEVVDIKEEVKEKKLRNTYSNEKILSPINISGNKHFVKDLDNFLKDDERYITTKYTKSDKNLSIEDDRLVFDNYEIICEENENDCNKEDYYDRYIIYGIDNINNAYYARINSEDSGVSIFVTTPDNRIFTIYFSTNSKYYDNINIREYKVDNINSYYFINCYEDNCSQLQDSITITTTDGKIYSDYCFEDEKNCSFKELLNK